MHGGRPAASAGSISPHYEAAGGLAQALDRDAEGALGGLDLAVTARRLQAAHRHRRTAAPRPQPGAHQRAAGRGRRRPRPRRGHRSAVRRERSQLRLSRRTRARRTIPRVDISHESLIRQWNRLRGWVDDERQARDRYQELVERARKREQGEAALLQDPELRSLSDWRDAVRPTPAWAARYRRRGRLRPRHGLSRREHRRTVSDARRGGARAAMEDLERADPPRRDGGRPVR